MHPSVTPRTVMPPEQLGGDHHTTVAHRGIQIGFATSRNPTTWQRCPVSLVRRAGARKAPIAKGKYQESSYQQHPALYIGLRRNPATFATPTCGCAKAVDKLPVAPPLQHIVISIYLCLTGRHGDI